MTPQIATILKDMLQGIDNGEDQPTGLLFIEKYAGLVVVGEKTQPIDIKGVFSVSKFPISLDSNYDECFNNGCYKDLVPNSKLKGMLYFEDYGTVPGDFQRNAFHYKSRLRLVCWINNKLIQGNDCKSISHLLVTQIRSTLENKHFNATEFSKIRVNCTNVINNDPKLFSKYTYPSESLKYLMHPYEAFGLDLMVEYSISANCLPDIILNPELC